MTNKRLDIRLVGHDFVYARANKKKEKPNQPDFIGDGVAVWVREEEDKPKPKLEGESKDSLSPFLEIFTTGELLE